jgi:1-acyl-sn-glycerol-3-phosphate acyltransferase
MRYPPPPPAEDTEPLPDPVAPTTRMPRAALAAYNVGFWSYLLGSCAAMFVPALGIWAVTARIDARKRLLARYTSMWGAHYLASAPLAGVTLLGRDKVDEDRPTIYVANHQSMSDILAIFAAHIPMLWVSKVENFYAPFLGWNMALNGFVPLRRGHLPSIMRMYRQCLRRLGEGHSLFVFPEGTRSPDGRMQPFYRGAFRLATRAGVPVQPLVVEGTADVLTKGSMMVHPRQCIVSILDPVYPDEVGGHHHALLLAVRSRMIGEQRRLRSPARSTTR